MIKILCLRFSLVLTMCILQMLVCKICIFYAFATGSYNVIKRNATAVLNVLRVYNCVTKHKVASYLQTIFSINKVLHVAKWVKAEKDCNLTCAENFSEITVTISRAILYDIKYISNSKQLNYSVFLSGENLIQNIPKNFAVQIKLSLHVTKFGFRTCNASSYLCTFLTRQYFA